MKITANKERGQTMKILRFTAENIKKLKVVEIVPDPKGNLIQITGANGQGKSSVLDAIYYCLAGTKGIPSEPVRKGSQKAHVTLALGDITVTRRFVEGGGTSLIVEAENGARFPSPQQMLDQLMGTLTFDPLEFTRMDGKKQLETLRSLVKLDLDIDALDAESKSDFDRRTDLNRQAKGLTARRDGILVQQGLPEKPVDVDDLVKQLENAASHNSQVATMKQQETQANNHIIQLRNDAADLIARAEKMKATALDLEKKLEKADKIPDPVDTAELAGKITQARVVNAAIALREQRSEIQSQLNDTEREAKELTAAIENRSKQRAEAIGAAKMPLESLSFGDGHVTYNGLPFDQASDAEQLRVSVAIAMAANPKLRVLRIKDGSLLDENSLKIVADMATKADYQVWIERVDTSGKVGIVMDDGSVATANAAPAAEAATATKDVHTKEAGSGASSPAQAKKEKKGK